MKKFLLILMGALTFSVANGQSNDNVYVYGVDFSYAKVFAADESIDQFAEAFERINKLIVAEQDKYDFSKMVKKDVSLVIEPMLEIVSSCDYSNLVSFNETYKDPDYSSVIKNYELPQTEGTGMVLIAKVLNKADGEASYQVIIFDIASRKIITEREAYGEAGGFGLRNYWAGSLHNVIKKTKLYK